MKKIISILLCMAMIVMMFSGCTTEQPQTGSSAQGTDDTGKAAGETDQEAKGTDAANAADTSGSDESELTFGMIVIELSNPFFVTLSEAVKEECAARGIEVIVSDAEGSSEKQVAAMENFISMGVDAIIVTPQDPQALNELAKKAQDQGIKIICHTTALENYDAWISAEEYKMGWTLGEAAGKWVSDHLGTEEEVQAVTLDYDISPSVIPRKEGIIDGCQSAAPNVKFVATATASDVTSGMETTENFLQAYPDLQVVLGINDGGALGAYEAFMSAGKDGDQYLVGGIDATDEGIAKVKEGGIYRITVDQNPRLMGKTCVDYALKAIQGETFEKDYFVELTAITEENCDNY